MKVRSVAPVVAAVVVALALGPVAYAVTWNEVGDAGDLPATAQMPTGTGSLTQIVGALSASNDVDMYKLCLTGGETFSAVVTSATTDLQLFLFNSAGLGVYSDDDTVGVNPVLPAGTAQTPMAPGIYYLAISTWNNDPLSAGGLIFSSPNEAVNGADGPGAAMPVIDWNDMGGLAGSYTICLTGVTFKCETPPNGVIPEPITMSGLALGLAAVGGYLRRRRAA